jgi:hypothetical protein
MIQWTEINIAMLVLLSCQSLNKSQVIFQVEESIIWDGKEILQFYYQNVILN